MRRQWRPRRQPPPSLSFLPTPDAGLRLAGPAHDLVGANTVGAREDDGHLPSHQPLPRRDQRRTEALQMDRRPRQNHRHRQTRTPNVIFHPLGPPSLSQANSSFASGAHSMRAGCAELALPVWVDVAKGDLGSFASICHQTDPTHSRLILSL